MRSRRQTETLIVLDPDESGRSRVVRFVHDADDETAAPAVLAKAIARARAAAERTRRHRETSKPVHAYDVEEFDGDVELVNIVAHGKWRRVRIRRALKLVPAEADIWTKIQTFAAIVMAAAAVAALCARGVVLILLLMARALGTTNTGRPVLRHRVRSAGVACSKPGITGLARFPAMLPA